MKPTILSLSNRTLALVTSDHSKFTANLKTRGGNYKHLVKPNLALIATLLFFLNSARGWAEHVVINFDDLPQGGTTGVVVSNQYPQVNFSSSPGFANYVTTQSFYNSSKPNFICTGPIGGAIDCVHATILDFAGPVNNLTFVGDGINDSGLVAQVDVFQAGGSTATVDVIGHASVLNPELVDLRQFTNVTKIVIRSITDRDGIGWDDFIFDTGPITITKADITSDAIEVVLTPTSGMGNLVVTIFGVFGGASGEITLFNGAKTGGTYTFSFNAENLPIGHYEQVRATWTVNGVASKASRNVAFLVLGKYRHSQYNTPLESTCGGAPVRAFITDNNCNFSETTLLSGFVNQVNLNGSGRSTAFGDVVREVFCTGQKNKQNKPPPGSMNHTFRRHHIVPSCEGSALDDTTVARMPGHPYLGCGDQILIVGLGGGPGKTKTVTDLCPGCPENQLDNYTTNPACSRINDLGRFVTIRLR
ncbi:MAG TPA: hypothetical protein VE031_00385 [Chthoniobacterales bacterium]|nr:hypothetical protein [Chthoniobacterales bacterium]